MCSCHQAPPVVSLLAELVQRRDVAGLVVELEEVLVSTSSDVPPAARRLQVAAVELLGEVASS